ncbi:MAG TPA: helical backbone metal receptor [Bacteroidia bacterium]|nr:helical backbone metal receptor [Bacteroidia bacterium]
MQFTDQTGHIIQLGKEPKRIISLVPSQSELLWDLGLKNELLGITKFCIHPNEMFESIERVGGTKQLNLEKIRALKPDLIIGNKEENDKAQIEELRKEFSVWMSDIYTIKDALRMIESIGELTEKKSMAAKMAEEIREKFSQVSNAQLKNKKVVYLMWNNPLMASASNTFIDSIIKSAGMINLFEERERYPVTDIQEIKLLNPDLILLSTEPFPFSDKHISEFEDLFGKGRVKIVDGEMFSWYGSRLLKVPDYLNQLFI